jgi:hypothetical protein
MVAAHFIDEPMAAEDPRQPIAIKLKAWRSAL